MKVELLHVINGYRKFHLGFYDDMHQAIKALKNHVYAYLERSANATWIIW